MRNARHLRFAALAVFIIMILVAAVPFSLNRSANDLLAQLRAEQLAQQRLDDILTSVRDAETAQRGFVITGKDAFLAGEGYVYLPPSCAAGKHVRVRGHAGLPAARRTGIAMGVSGRRKIPTRIRDAPGERILSVG